MIRERIVRIVENIAIKSFECFFSTSGNVRKNMKKVKYLQQ